MANKLTETLLVGPTFASLTGERRAAYIRQWKIGGAIFLILVVCDALILVSGHLPKILPITFLVLYGSQLIYALHRKETVWQLRFREIRYNSEQSAQNLQEVKQFMQQKAPQNGR